MLTVPSIPRNDVLFPKRAEDFLPSLSSFLADVRSGGQLSEAGELYVDLQSYLTKWVLEEYIKKGQLKKEDLAGAVASVRQVLEQDPNRLDALDREVSAIRDSGIREMCELTEQNKLKTRWGHDYCTGMDHSLRRGARFVTSNPAKVNLFRKENPELWQTLLQEVKAENPGVDKETMISLMCMKVVAISARRLYPIYEATAGEDGFACIQTNVLHKDDPQKMIDEVLFWEKAFRRELGVEDPNIVYKLPAVKAAVPVAEALVEQGIRVCMTLNFSYSQHDIFANILKKSKRRCFVVLMSGFLDDNVAKELESLGVSDPKSYARHAGEAVIRKSYANLCAMGCGSNVSIMAAAIRGDYTIRSCFTSDVASPVYFTTMTEKILEFDSEPRKMTSDMGEPQQAEILETLNRSEIFRQAYNRELLDMENIHDYVPLKAVLNVFTTAFLELVESFDDNTTKAAV